MSNPTQTEAEKCRTRAAAIAARHASPAALEAATADIARELELARSAAVEEALQPLMAFPRETYQGATKVLKAAGINSAFMADIQVVAGLMAVDQLLGKVCGVLGRLYPAKYGAPTAPAGAVAP